MKRRLILIGISSALLGAVWQPPPDDERPRLRRRAPPKTEFRESFAEGSTFRPNSKTLEGALKSVECRGKSARIHIVSGTKPMVFEVLDPKLVILKGAGKKEFEFTCGAQKPLQVAIEYVETGKIKSLYSLEFKTTPVK